MVKIDHISNGVVDIVLAHLLLNTKQKMIIHKIMRYIIYNQATPRFKQLDQLLVFNIEKCGFDEN